MTKMKACKVYCWDTWRHLKFQYLCNVSGSEWHTLVRNAHLTQMNKNTFKEAKVKQSDAFSHYNDLLNWKVRDKEIKERGGEKRESESRGEFSRPGNKLFELKHKWLSAMKATTREIQPITAYPADHISQSKCKAMTCCRLKAWGKRYEWERIDRQRKEYFTEWTCAGRQIQKNWQDIQ